MFNSIRIQLTIRNALVLSVILVALNLSVFMLTKQMLFSQVDRSLADMKENKVMTLSVQGGIQSGVQQRSVMFRANRMDRPMIQLYWTSQDQLVPSPASQDLGKDELKQLLPTRLGASLQTVKLGDQHYRVLTIANPDIAVVIGGDGQRYLITAQQLLSNVSAEMGMLRQLQYILLLGGSIGLVIAVAAGYYLANRALIPIRHSMEKQQQFVSDASHELRTPLSVIQAHTELLLRHPEHTIEQDSKHISTVLQEARRMSKLVGSLLTLARTDSDQLELEFKPVQVDHIIREGVRKMQMLAEVKDIILHTEIDSPVPMKADEERLQQLIVTLLDNAIKYTPEGGVVRIGCRKLAHSVQLEVEDTGIGIAQDNLPHIFDRFYRGDKARTRQEGGTGLGLAIAKWIVERHGGKIRVESKLSSGTLVLVTLPR